MTMPVLQRIQTKRGAYERMRRRRFLRQQAMLRAAARKAHKTASLSPKFPSIFKKPETKTARRGLFSRLFARIGSFFASLFRKPKSA